MQFAIGEIFCSLWGQSRRDEAREHSSVLPCSQLWADSQDAAVCGLRLVSCRQLCCSFGCFFSLAFMFLASFFPPNQYLGKTVLGFHIALRSILMLCPNFICRTLFFFLIINFRCSGYVKGIYLDTANGFISLLHKRKCLTNFWLL